MTRQATGPSHWPRRRKLREPKSLVVDLIDSPDPLSFGFLPRGCVNESANCKQSYTLRSIIGPAPSPFIFLPRLLLPCPFFCAQIWGWGWQSWLASVAWGYSSWCGRYSACLWVVWDGIDGWMGCKKDAPDVTLH